MKLEEYTKKYGNKEVDEKKLNELLGIKEGKVWKPVSDDSYYAMLVDGSVTSSCWHDSGLDECVYSLGNCFKTKEQAQFEVGRRRFLAFFERSLRENEEFEVDYSDQRQEKFDLFLNNQARRVHVNSYYDVQSVSRRYVTTNKSYLEKFIEEYEEELIKYYFEIK